MAVRHRSVGHKPTIGIRDVLIEELRRGTDPFPHQSPQTNADWGRLLRKATAGSEFHPKRIVEMKMLKEIIRILLHRRFDETRRTETRRRSAKKSWHNLYSIVFRQGEETVSYAAIIHIPEASREIERSPGTIHAARLRLNAGGEEIEFEDAHFDDYSREVKPHIEILGNLYRRTRRL